MSKIFKANLYLKYFGLFKVPLLFWSGAKVVHLDQQKSIIKIPLSWKTKNHLNSMYFGALSIGADCAAGLYASTLIYEAKKNIHLSFKDFNAIFLKRADSDTYFVNHQGSEIAEFVKKVIATPNTRMNFLVHIQAFTDLNNAESEVAKFTLTLSLKYKV